MKAQHQLPGLLAVALALGATSRADGPAFTSDLGRMSGYDARVYRAVLPRATELKWRQVPWTTDLAAAVKAAKKEERLLFLWVSGDDPLERC